LQSERLDAPLNISRKFSIFATFQPLMSWLKFAAFSNIICIPVTFEVSHLSRGWLKFEAPLNIASILLLDATFQWFKGWLKASASENIPSMFCTFETSQEVKGWLKDDAMENILHILTAFPTFQESKGWLKLAAKPISFPPWKVPKKSVTEDVSHVYIGSFQLSISSLLHSGFFSEDRRSR